MNLYTETMGDGVNALRKKRVRARITVHNQAKCEKDSGYIIEIINTSLQFHRL